MNEKKLKKKRGRTAVMAILLLLICCLGAYAYRQGHPTVIPKEHDTGQKEERSAETKKEIGDKKHDYPTEDESEEAEGGPPDDSGDVDDSDEKLANPERSDDGPASGDAGPQKKGHWETGYEIIAAWDEQVPAKAGYYESVLVSDAWDEEDTYCYAFGYDQIEIEVCNTCGAQFQGGINQHLSETGHSGWHNEYMNTGEQRCLEYRTDCIHHDAVYKQIWHEPEYRTVHHPEETISRQVWISD